MRSTWHSPANSRWSDAGPRLVAEPPHHLIGIVAEQSIHPQSHQLAHFGEGFPTPTCGACANCLEPRETYDGTVVAQKFLSCLYRIARHGGFTVGLRHVAAVLTGADLAAINPNTTSHWGLYLRDRPLIAIDRVRYVGDPVAAVAAVDEYTAEEALDAILVDYEPLPHVTDVDAAIAESGSIVVSTSGRIRNAWITPPIHIAIVRASQVVADLVDLFESRADALDAASTTVITGPSKTADIEGVLVTGVHGPAAVEIVLVD